MRPRLKSDSNPLLGTFSSDFSCKKIETIGCLDTDNGKNTSIKGTVTYNDISQEDVCVNGKNSVKEFYCASNNQPAQQTISCGKNII